MLIDLEYNLYLNIGMSTTESNNLDYRDSYILIGGKQTDLVSRGQQERKEASTNAKAVKEACVLRKSNK